MTASTTMTAEEFETQKPKLRTLSANTNELARLILVDGMSNGEAAKAVNMSPQNVSKAMRRVKALLNDLPSDYVWFEGFMPEDIAVATRKAIKERLEAEGGAGKNKH
jgi:hypothetical protein